MADKSVQDMIKTSRAVVPMIYAYTTPEIRRHDGWTKIGYTEQDVDTRLKQQTHTADVEYHKEWVGKAEFDDGSGVRFTDHDFHAYMRKRGVKQEPGKDNEWFNITGDASHQMFYAFRENHGILKDINSVTAYHLRDEQGNAVHDTEVYFKDHPKSQYLWNAKPRFGKTLSVYDLCKQEGFQNVLIVTNRPAIANSWYSDYEKFLGTESGYYFVSETDSLKGKPLVLDRAKYVDMLTQAEEGHEPKLIEFVSLQDLKGSKYFNPDSKIDKLSEVAHLHWDILVIDEAHEGVRTYKTERAFDHIDRDYTLHLSGTPFKALASDEFAKDAIFNWTYADEQKAKKEWPGDPDENPYKNLPKLNMFTYQMSEIVRDELKNGIDVDDDGENEEYAFDLNEFFRTDGSGRFVHDESVDKFLDALTTNEKYPFSTDALRNELKHTMWLLNRVDSCIALKRKLEKHEIFGQYKVVLAAGDGDPNDDGTKAKKSFDEVKDAISKYDKTITLSVGQLTTGVTIPEWTAVLMLCNMESPALYMQAAFRAQNPCLFTEGDKSWRKENAYVFDFDPARTLTIFEQFANDLNEDTANGKGDSATRKKHVEELLNFFPVIGEDDEGKMVELDAAKVLSIPRKIKCQEVVKRGFMSNFLFMNISNIFGAPKAVLDMINGFTPAAEPGKKDEKTVVTPETKDDLSLDDDGNVDLKPEDVNPDIDSLLGSKIFRDADEAVKEAAAAVNTNGDDGGKSDVERVKEVFHSAVSDSILHEAQNQYGSDMHKSDKKQLERELNDKADCDVNTAFDNYQIEKNSIEQAKEEALNNTEETRSHEEILSDFRKQAQDAADKLKDTLSGIAEDFTQDAAKKVAETVETKKKERERDNVMDMVRDHLRGFSRTIPSFLMSYGTDQTTLENFDQNIPDDVFKEVTGISLADFRFLRDGGDAENDDGVMQHYEGHLFDPVVFNDSVKEFMRLRKKLADYFDESQTEDIFDYIPPQKTNQIYTPRNVVKEMVDLLEKENPGCFDRDDKTFVDLYMKSGMYITEIVKRLYNSDAMKAKYPDGKDRLVHIFGKQVYGLAPTEIIYRIATNYIFGFSDEISVPRDHFRKLDALELAKDGTLEQKLEEMFPDLKDRED